MNRLRRVVIVVVLLELGIGLGCSTGKVRPTRVAPNGRVGFFDQFVRDRGETRISEIHSGDFRWPLREMAVTSPFGQRGREFHEGVDLKAKLGTSVYAAKAGLILYANSKIRGYGKMIVIRHGDRVASIYAHNSKLLVHRGERVIQGQKIAISGKTGHTRGPHLHFEIRKGVAAVDPIQILPSITRRSALVDQSRARLTAYK